LKKLSHTPKQLTPKWCNRLLKLCLRKDYVEEIVGDMEEIYEDNLETHSVSKANRIYLLETIRLLRINLVKNMSWISRIGFIDLLIINFKMAFRTIAKFKAYTLINLVGLSIGITTATFILLFVLDEFAFDDFHEKGERVFKVVTDNPEGAAMEANAWPVAYKLKTEYPEVEAALYAKKASSKLKINHNGKKFDHDIHFVSEDFFRLFSFPLLEGDENTALSAPFTAVITQTLAETYFENGSAIGETLSLGETMKVQVTGVVKNPPINSHIQFDVLLSFKTFEQTTDWFSYTEGWGNFNVRNYILLKEGARLAELDAKSRSMYMDNVGEWLEGMGMELYLSYIPLPEVYLQAGYGNGFGPLGSRPKVNVLILIGVFVLILACINYINLSTAKSVNRIKEIGIRKVTGSSRGVIILQVLSESFILSFFALLIAAIIMFFTLPFFNYLVGKSYDYSALLNVEIITLSGLLIIIISLLSGIYPALIMSAFKPINALKAKSGTVNVKGFNLRKLLIVFQFFISAVIISAAFIVKDQISYMQAQNLGFDKEQILVVNTTDLPNTEPVETFRHKLTSIPGIQEVSFNNALPGRPGWRGQWAYPEKVSEDHVSTEYMAIDEHYIETLGLALIAGRNFDKERPFELDQGLIINETCVKEMGWNSPEEAIGKQIVSPSERPAGTVIGVVKDYHGLGLQSEIWAKAMDYASHEYGRYYAIRFNTHDLEPLVAQLKKEWEGQFPNYGIDFFFLDQDFDRQYREEEQLSKVLTTFTAMVLIISCIGLLGLISFITLSKTKEVGIRKTLGASMQQIVSMLSREFLIMVIIGNLLAFPLIWYLSQQWLEDFAYHTEIQPFMYLISLSVTLILTFITISFQTIKTAKMNPVVALRYE
jgi:putative ABC transport system permease protein